MELKNLYSVFDRLAGEYAPPFLAANDAVAARAYRNLLRDVFSQDDYWLCRIGTFDPATATIVAVEISIVDTSPVLNLEVKNG